MKKLLAVLTLAFALCLACHAQRLVWETTITNAPSETFVPSAVAPDGTGGGAFTSIVFGPGTNFFRLVWFNAKGQLTAVEDVPFGTEILHVTPSVCDLIVPDSNTNYVRRLRKNRPAQVTFLAPADASKNRESNISGTTRIADKRNLFTYQQSATTTIIRRYAL